MRQAEVIIEPYNNSQDTVVQFSPTFKLDKKTTLVVPDGFESYVYLEEKPYIRRSKGEYNLLEVLSKENKDKSIKVAFIRVMELPEFKWGFGQVNIKNEKLGEAYTVGANGSYRLRIKDNGGKLISAFGTKDNITLDAIKEKTKQMFRKVGVSVLSDVCSKSSVSALNITSLIGEVKKKFLEALNEQEDGIASLRKYGMELQDFSVSVIFVPEEDIEELKKKIVDADVIENSANIMEEFRKLKDEILESTQAGWKDELARLKKEIARIAENQETDAVLDGIDNFKAEIFAAIKDQNNNSFDNETILKELENIKNQINANNGNKEVVVPDFSKDFNNLKKEILKTTQAGLKVELERMRDEISRMAQSQDTSSVLNEIDKFKAEITEKLNNDNKDNSNNDLLLKELENIKTQINANSLKSKNNEDTIIGLQKDFSSFQESVKEDMASIKEMLLENEKENEKQDSLPLYDQAKEEALKNIKITTDLLIEKAESVEDFSIPAGLIYSIVEKNLIEKFHVVHFDRKFYATMQDFNNMANKLGSNKFNNMKKQSIKISGTTYVPIPGVFRFLKAGLSKQDAITADNYWVSINQMRHQSSDNVHNLDRKLRELKTDKKTYLKKVLAFYRDKGLYTKD